jgi:hypothetical protein
MGSSNVGTNWWATMRTEVIVGTYSCATVTSDHIHVVMALYDNDAKMI